MCNTAEGKKSQRTQEPGVSVRWVVGQSRDRHARGDSSRDNDLDTLLDESGGDGRVAGDGAVSGSTTTTREGGGSVILRTHKGKVQRRRTRQRRHLRGEKQKKPREEGKGRHGKKETHLERRTRPKH